MPRSEYRDAVDAIQAALRRWLRERGFRVRGRTFNHVTDDRLTQVIGVQMGPFESLLAAQAADVATLQRNPRHADYVRKLAVRLGIGELDA